MKTVTGTASRYEDKENPYFVILYFHLYIVLTSWVVMSLFIGVITM